MEFLKKLKYNIGIGLFLISLSGFSQNNFSNYKTKTILQGDSVQLDSLSIIPNSLILSLDTSYYDINYFKAFIRFKQPSKDSLLISYQTFPLNFTSVIQNRSLDTTKYTRKIRSINPYSLSSQNVTRDDLFGSTTLKKGGSISRGINIGNTRDLSINSAMNLQLSGTFQGIEIMASVTDNNIPIQPQGNTQTLQDFDKVFIQFGVDNQKVLIGDFQTIEKNDLFLKYNKKAQGLSYNGTYNSKFLGKKAKLEVKTDLALSRGKFNRQNMLGIEGNQGPYRLTGAESEPFIIILSGTERIYIDGKLMKRGMDADYIINYNSAELTFTTNQLITKDKRIIAEFQYSDQNYGRSLFTSSNKIKSEKGSFFVNMYTEQDMKFQQLQQALSQDQLELLNTVGDSLQYAISQKIDTIDYNQNQVLYKSADTIIENFKHTYFKYSNDPDSAIYSLSFSNLGDGNGDYELTTSTANGRVYKWTPPINGSKQGSYEPIIQLIAPKQQQMLTFGGAYKTGKNSSVFFETALSNQNQNLFSEKHKQDNQGVAFKANYTKVGEWKTKSKKPKNIKTTNTLSYQLINKNFTSIERFRSVEFNRDFNLNFANPETNEQTVSWKMDQSVNNKKVVGINLSYIERRKIYYGLKSAGTINTKLWKGCKLDGKGSYLKSEGQTQGSQFLRHLITFQQKLTPQLTVKLWEEEEWNPILNIEMDTLASNSFRYTVLGSELKIENSENTSFSLTGNQRIDFLPMNNLLHKVTTGKNAGVKFTKNSKKGSKFLWSSTFRELTINRAELVDVDPENTFLNRIDYKFKLWKGMVKSSSFFEIASGSELRRQFQYIEVNPGQGIYAWIDYNNDSIQDLNEFEVSQFTDQANYIRVYLPTTDFIKTYSNQFNQSFNVNPSRFYKRNKNWKKFITRFNNQFLMKMKQKISKDQSQRFFIPFQNDINDTNLISVSSSLRNTIYFNRSNPKYGLNYTIKNNQNKNLLNSGFEARNLLSNSIDFRWNISKRFTFRNKAERSSKGRNSQIFSANEYKIDMYSLEPKISYQKGANFRTSLKSSLKNKTNQPQFGGEFTQFRKFGIETTYTMVSKGRMTAGLDFVSTTFNGESLTGNSSPLSFDMLEGFQIGTNYTWKTTYQRSFKNNLQLSVRYEGRTSETSKVVHTGNMQVQLMF